MKKMIYSNYTKFIAVVLCIASIVAAALTAMGGLSDYLNEEHRVYYFENDFSESAHLVQLLREPAVAISTAYDKTRTENFPVILNETLAQEIGQALNNLDCADKINYYVWWNNIRFTNCGAMSPEELMQGDFYSHIIRDHSGSVRHESKPVYTDIADMIDDRLSSSWIITCNIKQEYLDEYKVLWEQQEAIVTGAFTKTLCFVLLALLFLIYLICVCGQNKDGEVKTMWLDHIWAEVHLAVLVGVGLGAVLLGIFLIDAYWTGRIPTLLNNVVIGALPLASAIAITSLLSIVRNIKCRRFLDSSIVFRVIRRCWRVFVKVLKWVCKKLKAFGKTILDALSRKTGIISVSMLMVYTALLVACCFAALLNFRFFPFWILLGVLVFGFACFVVLYRAKDIDEVRKGVSQVRSGNVSYKIPALKSSDLKLLGENISDLAKGLDESVAAQIKAERLKTELITNVSHDLKTPITSIISYTELLSKIEELPEEARDYVQVIAKKSERLKNLTQDLFDISKAQSGNEEIILEKLDVALLLNQSLGEHDSEIQESGLPFCVAAPKELYILADGRKMSRVVGNLINNILKYTLRGTRVFITALEKDGEVVMEFKNIASYPMEFNDDEIVGRFVRGDESRTAEGNGLGLAIVKSYTELCNGKFEIVTDGDMFKAILRFRKYS